MGVVRARLSLLDRKVGHIINEMLFVDLQQNRCALHVPFADVERDLKTCDVVLEYLEWL